MRLVYFSIMPKKIVISSFNNTGAIVCNNKIQEIFSINSNYQVNDIYLGSVHKIFSSINAAFINLGSNKKSGFIHLNDLKYLKKSHRFTQIQDILSINQQVFVQVVKEPTLNKGPRLTANINLFGRYLALMPFCNTIHISRKIYDQNERSYLYALAVLLKPPSMGLLIRSSASSVNEGFLVEDLNTLKKQWSFIQKLALINKSPCLLYKDEDLVKKMIRDLYSKKISLIIADSSKILNRVRYYLNKWYCSSPNNHNKRLRLLKQSDFILEKFNIKSTIVNALKPKVSLSIGGYLFIEAYEAFTIIDVNSGSFNQSNDSRETVLKMNCYAATEIAYQMKIRNINGIVIIDFIDMESYRDQLQLLEHFTRVLSIDSAKPQIVQMSKLGLVELTRRRRAQSLFELFYHQDEYGPIFNHDHISLSLVNKKSMIKNDLIYKNINSLFFGTFFTEFIYLYYTMGFNQKEVNFMHTKCKSFSRCIYTFTVPSLLYSQIMDAIIKS